VIKSNSDLYLPITTKPNLRGQQRAMQRGLFAATDGVVDTRFACVRESLPSLHWKMIIITLKSSLNAGTYRRLPT